MSGGDGRASDDHGVSPIVAILVLIVVSLVGAGMIALLIGNFSSDITRRAFGVDFAGEAAQNVLVVTSPAMQQVSQRLAEQYTATHTGVKIDLQDGENRAGVAAVGMDIADVGATSRAPTPEEMERYPGLKSEMAGGRAVVIIAHDDLDLLLTTGVSKQDMQTVYSPTKQTLSMMLHGVTHAVRNTDKAGCEDIFAGWLTDGQASTLDGYTTVPDDVTLASAQDDVDTFSFVASTPGAIGFIDWLYVSGNDPAASHVNVIPIYNLANGNIQSPDRNNIVAEIKSMNNDRYDAGLVSQLFYVTNGGPGGISGDYVRYALSPGAISLYSQSKTYSALELE